MKKVKYIRALSPDEIEIHINSLYEKFGDENIKVLSHNTTERGQAISITVLVEITTPEVDTKIALNES